MDRIMPYHDRIQTDKLVSYLIILLIPQKVKMISFCLYCIHILEYAEKTCVFIL